MIRLHRWVGFDSYKPFIDKFIKQIISFVVQLSSKIKSYKQHFCTNLQKSQTSKHTKKQKLTDNLNQCVFFAPGSSKRKGRSL